MKSTEEFDRAFDRGADIVDDLDLGTARRPHVGIALKDAAQHVGGVELSVPERDDQARAAEFE
ncbi:hypothetical protein [uncultured Corynebacterium sp.]|uniref:hypothetical protein n=1 Tax=uncultured Corynebacterium sp. TaxID=159447 RepID=UPI0025F9A4A8|nr:hypothetical protein [uncultured Corynebacterium sp.]